MSKENESDQKDGSLFTRSSLEEIADMIEQRADFRRYLAEKGAGRNPDEIYDAWVNDTMLAGLALRLEKSSRLSERSARLDSEFKKRIGKVIGKVKVKGNLKGKRVVKEKPLQ